MLYLLILLALSWVDLAVADCKSTAASYQAPYDLSATSTFTVKSAVFVGDDKNYGSYYIQTCGTVDSGICPFSTGQQQCFAMFTWQMISDGLGAPDQATWSPLDGESDWSKGAVSVSKDIQTDYDQCNADPPTNSFKTTYYCDKGDNSVTLVSEPSADKNGPCVFEFKIDSSIVCAASGGGVSTGGDNGGSTGGDNNGDSATKKGLSGGWIFVIVVLVVLFVYFIGGIINNRYRHGKGGIEMLPHSAFWLGLPGLVTDGCSYFVTKCGRLCGVKSAASSSDYNNM